MANAMYTEGKDAILDGTVDLLTADIRAVLVDVGQYTFSAAHDNLDDVAAGSRIAVSGSLTGKTIVSGLFSGTVPTITAVSGATVEAVIIYCHDGGADTARRLICYIDTEDDDTTPISFTPNGSDVDVSLPDGIIQI